MTPTSFNELANWAGQSLQIWLFYFLSFVVLPFAYGVLYDRNIIRAGFLLIGMFGGISGLFLLLGAQFLAMAQLMIYAVGITLVVVIALMLTNPRLELEVSPTINDQRLPALLVSVLLFVVIYLSIRSESWPVVGGPSTTGSDNLKTIGISLLTQYSLPFEFASVLLLIALMGAVMLAKADKFFQAKESSDDSTGALTGTTER